MSERPGPDQSERSQSESAPREVPLPAEVHESLAIVERAHPEQAEKIRQYTERLRQDAYTDQLTGAWNRQATGELLTQMLNENLADPRANRLGLIIADVDHFKAVNDTHGHPIGDSVLKDFASTLRSSVRGSDFVARIGGEEFIIVVQGLDEEGLQALAQTICGRVADKPVDIGKDDPLGITASFGAVAFRPTSRHFTGEHADDSGEVSLQPDSAEAVLAQLMEQADRALYEAKEGGRNRVVFSRGDSSPNTEAAA